jgi:hypothetical protein
MSADVINLSDRRPPVTFDITITQGWDGSMELLMHGLADDDVTRFRVADTLSIFADAMKRRVLSRAGIGAPEDPDGWKDGPT